MLYDMKCCFRWGSLETYLQSKAERALRDLLAA